MIAGVPDAVGGDGVVLRYVAGRWEGVRYPDSIRMYLRAIAPIGHALPVAGGGGTPRMLATSGTTGDAPLAAVNVSTGAFQ